MFAPANLQALLYQTQPHRNKTYWLAYSGGLDSHVLLQAFVELAKKNSSLTLKAVHINHGLSPNANRWQEHCQRVCRSLNIECQILQVSVDLIQGISREDAARKARYQAFQEIMSEEDCLVTAHHQDDQAETVLFRLFRGAGPHGLAGMLPLKHLAVGTHWRPLLSYSRSELYEYAMATQLTWITDETNFDAQFDRNFIRQNLLPLIQQRWPKAAQTIARVATNCQEANQILDEIATQDMADLRSSKRSVLRVSGLLILSQARRNNVIRFWLNELGYLTPSRRQLEKLYSQVLLAAPDAQPLLHWGDVSIRRFRDDLYAIPSEVPLKINDQIIPWELPHDRQQVKITLPQNLGVLQAKKVKGLGIYLPFSSKLHIRFRQGGEYCCLPGRRTHRLKKLWQEWSVPPWLRDSIPLLYFEEELVSVIGYCICLPFIATQEQEGWMITHRH